VILSKPFFQSVVVPTVAATAVEVWEGFVPDDSELEILMQFAAMTNVSWALYQGIPGANGAPNWFQINNQAAVAITALIITRHGFATSSSNLVSFPAILDGFTAIQVSGSTGPGTVTVTWCLHTSRSYF